MDIVRKGQVIKTRDYAVGLEESKNYHNTTYLKQKEEKWGMYISSWRNPPYFNI